MMKINYRMAIVKVTATATRIATKIDPFGDEVEDNDFDFSREIVELSDEIFTDECDDFGDYRTANSDANAWAETHMIDELQYPVYFDDVTEVGQTITYTEASKIEIGKEYFY